jgi:uncharacterized heparinase superfamily protein
MRARLLADAARQVTWRQALGRPRRLLHPAVLAGRSPGTTTFEPLARGLAVEEAPQSGPLPPPHLDGTFRAVGREREARDPELWSGTGDGLLFLFHLHGFSDLARYTAGERSGDGDAFWTGVLERWLRSCGRPGGAAWHPFPTSSRVLSWCAALSAGGWSPALADALAASLAWQLQMLRRSVEDDVGGNHVLRNAAALVVGGVCCGDKSARRRGEGVLERELPRQILADGGHEERSPSYTRLVLRDLADSAEVLRRAERPVSSSLEEAIARMRAALGALVGPDGRLPRMNDAWDGPALEQLPGRVHELAASGWVVFRDGADQAVIDVGPLCPPHLPPHAHADALSFVLWGDGRPVVVDPGTGSYEPEDRGWARATRSHATVEVDGQDQCVFWGVFRASLLPRVSRGPLDMRPDAALLTARHDGYRRLPDPVEHVRTFCWLPGDGIVVVDRLRARAPHEIVSSIPLAEGSGPFRVRPLRPDTEVTQRETTVAPYLGALRSGVALEQRARVAPDEPFGWILTRSEARVVIEGEVARVERPGRGDVSFTLPR